MLGLPRRSMLRLARPIMIGRDAALARRFAARGALPPLAPPRFAHWTALPASHLREHTSVDSA
jgi:hypothetical protein